MCMHACMVMPLMMKSDFFIILLALGTLVCVTRAFPTATSSTVQQLEDHTQRAASQLTGGARAVVNRFETWASNLHLHRDNTNMQKAEAQLIGTAIVTGISLLAPIVINILKTILGIGSKETMDAVLEGIPQYSQGQPLGYPLTGYSPSQYGNDYAAIAEDLLTLLIQTANSQLTGGAQASDKTQASNLQLNRDDTNMQNDDDVSSNAEEENKLESELLQVANDQRWRARLRRRKVVPFRRDRFIKNPGQWKLKPKRKGFFASILQFFKNLW